MEPKMGKRIVSKGEYARSIALGITLGFTGVFLVILTCLCTIVLVGTLLLTLYEYNTHWYKGQESKNWVIPLCLSGFLGVGTYILYKASKSILFRAERFNTGVPLTRANTADLPVPDSLVRASSEPQQAQEGVLLRAAAQGQQTPPEQLVRATVGEAQE